MWPNNFNNNNNGNGHKINKHNKPNLQLSVSTNKPDQIAEMLEDTRKMMEYSKRSLKHNPSHSNDISNHQTTLPHLTQTRINVNLITKGMR